MQKIAISLCLLLVNFCYGQEFSPDAVKSIVSSYRTSLAGGDEIVLANRKITRVKPDLYKIEDRSPSGKLASIKYTNSIPTDITFPEVGLCTEFYENGKVKNTRNYMDSGTMISEYFNNGSLYKEYSVTILGKILIEQVGDIAGNILVKNGAGKSTEVSDNLIVEIGLYKESLKTGTWRGYYEDGTLYYEENYNKEGLVSGKAYDNTGKSYAYKTTYEKASFKGGETKLHQFLANNINVKNEQDSGIVPVDFVIDELGNVRDAKSQDNENTLLIKHVLKVINSTSGKWLPAKHRGIPIKSDYFQRIVVSLK